MGEDMQQNNFEGQTDQSPPTEQAPPEDQSPPVDQPTTEEQVLPAEQPEPDGVVPTENPPETITETSDQSAADEAQPVSPDHDDLLPEEVTEPNQPAAIEQTDQPVLPDPHEELLGPGQIQDPVRAEHMADVVNKTRTELLADSPRMKFKKYAFDHIAEEASDKYEIGVIAKREGKTPEQVKALMNSNVKYFLEYASKVAENIKQAGDQLSPDLEVIQALHDVAEQYSELLENGCIYSRNDMILSLKRLAVTGGCINVNITYYDHNSQGPIEEWFATPFEGTLDKWNQYKITDYDGTADGFEYVTTTKQRRMTHEDAEHFKQLIAKADFDHPPEFEEDGEPFYNHEQSEEFEHDPDPVNDTEEPLAVTEEGIKEQHYNDYMHSFREVVQ